MASNNNLNDVFNDIATAINNKGVSGTMTPTEMADKIAEIPTGGGSDNTNMLCFNLQPSIVFKFSMEVS